MKISKKVHLLCLAIDPLDRFTREISTLIGFFLLPSLSEGWRKILIIFLLDLRLCYDRVESLFCRCLAFSVLDTGLHRDNRGVIEEFLLHLPFQQK